MSTVEVTIGPHTYPIVCGDGEEAQVERLAALIAEKYALLGDARTPQESQNLLFAALILADELTEARREASETAEQETANSGGKKAELRAQIEELRRTEERALEENTALKAELTKMRDEQGQQLGMSGDDELAEHLEELAARAEAAAAKLEGAL